MSLTEQIGAHVGEGSVPTEEELARPYVSPSEAPTLPRGIVFSGDWKKFADGMARHTRAQATALAAAGVPVSLQSISSEGMFLDSDVKPEVRREVAHLTSISLGSVLLAIRHAIFHHADFTRNLVLPAGGRLSTFEDEQSIYRSTVVYTSLERDTVSPALIEIFKRCAEVWVPCEANARAMTWSGMPHDRVRVIPFPYDPAGAVSQIPLPRGRHQVPDGKRFYSIGKWEPRKNHAALLRAFLWAFTPKDRASLVLKVHGWGAWDGYPSIEEALAACGTDEKVLANGWTNASLARRVRIIPDKISDEEIVALHAQNNIYVSASHGEAWDIPAFEAKCAGNRLVHVAFGGTADYAGLDDVLVPCVMAPVHRVYGWEGSNWADYEIADLASALRAAEPPKSRVHPPSFNERFSVHAVGEKMKERVLQIVARNNKCDTAAALKLLTRGGSFG